MSMPRSAILRMVMLLGAALVGSAAWAQSTVTGVPNAVQGFSTNRDQPIQIEATTLEVRDKESIATFSGNVHVIQGDTHMRSQRLQVFYDQEGGKQGGGKQARPAGRPAQAATPGPAGQQQIRRLVAGGTVVVTQKDQEATGDEGIFDTQTNSVTLRGNVIVKQGPNVLRGDRLVVHLETGVSKMEGVGGRVQAIIQPGSAPPGAMPPSGLPGSGPRPPAGASVQQQQKNPRTN